MSSSARAADPPSSAFSRAAFSSTSPPATAVERSTLDPRILGRDLELLDLIARQPDRPRFRVQGDLVEPGAVDHERLLDAHCGERLRDAPKHLRIGDSEQLDGRARRIDARAEQIHDGAHFQLPPHQRGMLHARVVGGGEEEAEAGLVEQRPRLCGRKVDPRADGFEHVGGAAARADAAIAVLGDRQPAGHGDERSRSRHVDQPRSVPAGAAAIGIEIVGAVERLRRGAKRSRGADHFLGGLALHPQGDQHSGNLGGLELAEHQPLEQMLGILDWQVFAGEQLGQWVGDRLRRIVSSRVRGRSSSSGVAGESRNLVHALVT